MNRPVGADEWLTLEPGRTARHYWTDLWKYRELFLILGWRDISVRYKQTVIGVAWAIVRPLLTMMVFTVIFGRLAGLPSDGNIPYALLVLSGMLPWLLFSSTLTEASNSIVGNAHLLTKVYFPRAIFPAATVVASLLDFAISLGILAILMAVYGVMPTWHLVFLPAFILMAVAASLGPGLWITGLNVKYRDFRHIVPFILQLGMYVSPVGFTSSIVPEKWRVLYGLNPVVGVIDGFRWCLFGGQSPMNWPSTLVSVLVVSFFLLFGIRQFRMMEKTFADLA